MAFFFDGFRRMLGFDHSTEENPLKNPPAGKLALPKDAMKEAVKIVKEITGKQNEVDPYSLQSQLSKLLATTAWTPSYWTISNTIQALGREVDQLPYEDKDELKTRIASVFSGALIQTLDNEESGNILAITEQLAKIGNEARLRDFIEKIPKEYHRDVALIYCEHNPVSLCANIPLLTLDEPTRLELAKKLASRKPYSLFSHLDKFAIGDVEQKYQIVKALVESKTINVSDISKSFVRLGFTESKHILPLAILEASMLAERHGSCTSAFSALQKEYTFTPDDLSEIARVIASTVSELWEYPLESKNGEISFFEYFIMIENDSKTVSLEFLSALAANNRAPLIAFINSLPIDDNETKSSLLQAAASRPQDLCTDPQLAVIRGQVGKRMALHLEKKLNQPVDPDVIRQAHTIRTQYPPIQDVSKSPEKYEVLNSSRRALSGTLKSDYHVTQEENREAIAKWNDADAMIRAFAHEKNPFTKEFLCQINRSVNNTDGPGVIRKKEVSTGMTSLSGYLYHEFVNEQLDKFLVWLNAECKACDEGNSNPIVIAALAYQRFVSIHPFADANGRTGRLVMDLVLQRYQLPPATLAKSTIAMFAWLHKNKTPSDAVKLVIDGIKNSYELMR